MDGKTYQDYVEEIDLQRYWLVLKRRWLPASLVFAACVVAAALVGLSQKDTYQASGKLLFQVDRSTSLTGVGDEIGDLEAVNPVNSDPLSTQAAILSSLPVLQEAVNALDLQDAKGNSIPPDVLRRGLTIAPLEGTDVLRVAYQSPNGELSAAVVNQVMTSYIERNITMNRSEATAARQFVQEQLPKAEAEVEQAAEALRQFKDQNQIIALESEANAAVSMINNLETQIGQAQAQLASAITRTGELRRQLGIPLAQARQVDSLSQSPGVQRILEDLQAVQTELASQRSRYTASHPLIANLEREQASLQTLLNRRVGEVLGTQANISPGDLQMSELSRQLTSQLTEAEVNRLSLASQVQALLDSRQAYIEWSQAFPALEKRQLELEQRLLAAKTNYETLLVRLQEAQLAENQTVGSAQILEPAAPPRFPVGTSTKKYIAAGGAVGLLLGVAMAFFLDLIDKSIKTVKDGEALLGYTLLGLIPKFGLLGNDGPDLELPAGEGISPRVIAFSQTQPMVTAAYQMLQANLKFISSDTPRRALTLTSSVPQEGKSEVAANLAATIAQTGKQVLLVDADMRSPWQHHLWNVVNQIGLSHVLVGEGHLNQALRPVANNLTLLSAGVTPPNPLALIDSERMAALVRTLAKRYDYVLFDTPPLIGAADAAVLGRATDGVLLVLRPRLVDSASAQAAKSLLQRSGAEILGMVANGVDIRHEHDDYVSHVKAGAYPYGQRRDASTSNLSPISTELSDKT
ncbi:Tyrosine-protein kinase wzc [Halomicronema hongdechloris C2206]|uniref:Tyrosine-protein kinase wzc n=1 Tax=Halomicronema hongdechloris C2206 TaxID=1641165 RepID=A0A1Z3HMQ0_9CYAN|nr:polysaccharide biosynthesis tyrosine autokinase [Halomicronema hongdechloris]ASC71555.1 Tyrosine-protein kinase wzc [Halomicronema hongdechloris C2206]